MSAKLLWAAGLTAGICGCATMHEVKVTIDQTPPAVQQTINRELVGARLEDIAKKQRQGKTVYETDIVKDGYKWEVVIGEDGFSAARGRAAPHGHGWTGWCRDSPGWASAHS